MTRLLDVAVRASAPAVVEADRATRGAEVDAQAGELREVGDLFDETVRRFGTRQAR